MSQSASNEAKAPAVPPLASEATARLRVVGIGASAGGLDASRKLIGALPANSGMAFILVQHLDPTHESLMVDLLSKHTEMPVRQAVDGVAIEPDHVYVIPPGTYLSVVGGALSVSVPLAHHGARMPYDFLLHSLAEAFGAAAAGVVLSGTGSDGALGLLDIKKHGGLAIAQNPGEAAFDGMPQSAIQAGAVNMVLSIADIPDALTSFDSREPVAENPESPDWLPRVIGLLRAKTTHDFALYKPGTLRRRIERRMAIKSLKHNEIDHYLDLLQGDDAELDLLAKDLLIHVTSFFRDPRVFDVLADEIIPGLVQRAGPDGPLRIWIPGCSTGEEAYSMAILFREAIAAAKLNVKLQLFASDVDPDAVASAREGAYPKSIEGQVSPERLARYFSRDEHGYRVAPELRSCVVFTVLADPPFARLDMVSCRNLLIYLAPEAQAKVISLFHFALREGGVLLLGNAETIGGVAGRFEVISKPARLYRHIGGRRPGDLGFSIHAGGPRAVTRTGQDVATGGVALAELCRRMVMDEHTPAAVLVNRAHDCLYSLGPTDRYLRMAPGHTTQDVLAMARPGVRARLKSAIERVGIENARVMIDDCATSHNGQTLRFSISAQPVPGQADGMVLVCFIAGGEIRSASRAAAFAGDESRVSELERELEATKAELRGAIRDLEIVGEEHKAVNEEAMSVNEEFQSTNEELLTSKEELQSLNEELTALNGQLQETLERQRTTSDDLQNVLYSTDIALLFLDTDLNIRFFTPAIRAMFSVIAGDIGRPLADLTSLSADNTLEADAREVLKTRRSLDREVEAGKGQWFQRRILPYLTHDKVVEGVVLTFTDISERKHLAAAREDARTQADAANAAKSRFLAAASHDLRQPLQTIALLQGLLAKAVDGERAKRLVSRLEEALGAMSGMLNTMLDINQIEAGVVQANPVDFAVNDLLRLLREEFAYHAQAQRLVLHVVECRVHIRSDPSLLEQMLRNLLSNALKYTKTGKVLMGCRRRGEFLSIEVWDTGIGIPKPELATIFDEYHQLDNAARERSQGLGLGLSIVQRLANLLGHGISVRSEPGRGSVFSIEVPIGERAAPQARGSAGIALSATRPIRRTGAILIIEDDPEVRELLEWSLREAGHRTTIASAGTAAIQLAAGGMAQPDLILADFNLPGGMDGLQAAGRLREAYNHAIPVVILTGDISSGTLREIADQGFLQLNKPVKPGALFEAIGRLLPVAPAAPADPVVRPAPEGGGPVIYIVDDDHQLRGALREVLEAEGRTVMDFESCEAFLEARRPGGEACLLVDAYLPGMSGLALLEHLKAAGDSLASIMITGASDVPMAVQAMKAGARDFIEKPIGADDLIAAIDRALELSRDRGKRVAWRDDAAAHMAALTPRQLEIMDMVLAGHPSKNIAADLGISQRTVENHRAAIMQKTGSKSLPALARLALAAV